MRIRIKATPPGQAPVSIREQWVDCVMETLGREDADKADRLLRAGTANIGGYRVRGAEAFKALMAKGAGAAAAFWASIVGMDNELIFKAEVCEEVPS